MIDGRTLLKRGYPQGPVIGRALRYAREMTDRHKRPHTAEADFDRVILDALDVARDEPERYTDCANAPLRELAAAWLEVQRAEREQATSTLREQPRFYYNFADELTLDPGATEQMDLAMRVPVARAGALMADAHRGYGLPIGGVWALENAVSPNAVGSDIGCQVVLSVFDMSPRHVKDATLAKLLMHHTAFNHDTLGPSLAADALIEEAGLEQLNFVRKHPQVLERVKTQFGSAGDGNHFAVFGSYQEGHAEPRLALVTHWGSRAFGAKIGAYYHKLAQRERYKLAAEARQLAWLELGTDLGDEYWVAMEAAVAYARAGHLRVHWELETQLGVPVVRHLSSVHNVASAQRVGGQTLVVHRKGAVSAGVGEAAVIPGSMTHPIVVVRGRGHPHSLASASHGAGRRLSRTQARETLKAEDLKAKLEAARVTLIGGDVEESPDAYKNLGDVMRAQSSLVVPEAQVVPRVVRMAAPST